MLKNRERKKLKIEKNREKKRNNNKTGWVEFVSRAFPTMENSLMIQGLYFDAERCRAGERSGSTSTDTSIRSISFYIHIRLFW